MWLIVPVLKSFCLVISLYISFFSDKLLHTKCRPGLKLSREYQGTPAQVAVKHMPWWAQGCETTGKMVISYDNLIRRLWLHGAIFPYSEGCSPPAFSGADAAIETLLNEDGMPPIPHEHWVHRLGFQQQDPVTDFRSGGVLSLALMLHLAESCPAVFRRFVRPSGDASVLPFGITSINVTDMLSKFLMLAKTVDRMDALLSQKPFWRMFADPNAITACQELAMDLLADVVVEFRTRRGTVSVFDFSAILAKTERRVQYDLLGAGPRTVAELYDVHAKAKLRYQRILESELSTSRGGTGAAATATAPGALPSPPASSAAVQAPERSSASAGGGPASSSNEVIIKDQVVQRASVLASSASQLAGSVLARIKQGAPGGFNPLRSSTREEEETEEQPATTTTSSSTTTVDGSIATLPSPALPSPVAASSAAPAEEPRREDAQSGALSSANTASTAGAVPPDEDEWVQADGPEMTAVADGASAFSIVDDDDDYM
jgi:hypothetical protein